MILVNNHLSWAIESPGLKLKYFLLSYKGEGHVPLNFPLWVLDVDDYSMKMYLPKYQMELLPVMPAEVQYMKSLLNPSLLNQKDEWFLHWTYVTPDQVETYIVIFKPNTINHQNTYPTSLNKRFCGITIGEFCRTFFRTYEPRQKSVCIPLSWRILVETKHFLIR